MFLGELSENVIIIDVNFLNAVTKETLEFYTKSKPEKKFEPYNLGEIIYMVAQSAKINAKGDTVDVILAYNRSQDELYFCEQEAPSGFILESEMETDIGDFKVRSFFGEEDDTSNVKNTREIIDLARQDDNVENIIIVADNAELNDTVQEILDKQKQNILMFKLYRGTQITADVYYVNFEHIVAFGLGLTREEL
jgi:hypothetical protein